MKNQDFEDFMAGEHVEGSIYTAVEAWCTDQAAAKAQYGPIASWDTSEVTNMSYLFYHTADFNEDISRWDVSSVTDLTGTLYGATSFNGDLSRWDVSNVTSLDYTFYGATSFNQQLGGLWSDIAGLQSDTFGGGCPGSIV